jgi:hypothetical protein
MSIQMHAPPNKEEYESIRRDEATGNRTPPVGVLTWREDGGWCSSCRSELVTVAHMGTHERNFALCGYCLSRLIDTLKAPLCTPDEPKP